MSTFIYTRPSDNLLDPDLSPAPVLAVNTGVEDAAYLAANLGDGLPQKPAKLTGFTGSWTANLGSAKRVDLVSIIHSNLDASLAVSIQGHTSNAWGAPDVSQAFTIPARYADRFPVNVWLDLKTLVPVDANRTKQWWRLNVSGTNSVAVSVGEWGLYNTKRDLGIRNIKWGATRTWRRPAKIHETDVLVRKRYDVGTTIRGLSVEIDPTDAILAEVHEWWRSAAGAVNPFLIVPHSDEVDAWFVTFSDPDQPYVRSRRNYNTATLEFIEMSRGLYP